MEPQASEALPGSFRDPSGFVFFRGGACYRQVNAPYREHYEHLMGSGLYAALARDGLLVPHEETREPPALPALAYKVLRPEAVPFISYPYEWCFSQLKDAALATLALQKRALEFGMVLKDASAYNIQFVRGRPACIDTLSFERYTPGQVWTPYRQFCQHFLAPLALMSRCDVRLGQLLSSNLDGLPLDLASRLLPRRTWLRPALCIHVHLHARSQRRYARRAVNLRGRGISKLGLMGLVDSLEAAVSRLRWTPSGTPWADYQRDTNYTERARGHKRETVARFVERLRPRTVWALGANTGEYARIPAERGILTLALDMDPACVEKAYLWAKDKRERNLLPLLADVTNPSPAIGWGNEERMSLAQRGPCDTLTALALVHHLAIGNNVPLPRVAAFFASIGRSAIVEFVPKHDSQVQRMLATREDVFPDYTQEAFERAFGQHFAIEEAVPVAESHRTLYCMVKREASA